MIQLDLTQKLKDYDDQGQLVDMPDSLGKCLATMLKAAQTTEVVKYYGWFVSLATSGKLTLDQADCDALEQFVKTHTGAILLLKGQLLQSIAKARLAAG